MTAPNTTVVVARTVRPGRERDADASMLEPLRDPITAALTDAQVLVLDLDELNSVDPTYLREPIVEERGKARGGQLRIATTHAACQRCGAVASLELDDRDPVHEKILRSIRPSESPPANP